MDTEIKNKKMDEEGNAFIERAYNLTQEQMLILAQRWLSGYIDTSQNVAVTSYYKPKSDDENLARFSVSQLIMNNELPKDLLQLLAYLIAPDDQRTPFYSSRGLSLFNQHENSLQRTPEAQGRRLDFNWRKKHKASDAYLHGCIISRVQELIGDGLTKTAAFEKAADEFHRDKTTIRAICKKYPMLMKWYENERNR